MGYIIYKITNKVNNKHYFGYTSTTLNERLKEHIKNALYKESNTLLHKAIRKYGYNHFIIEPVCFCDTQKQAKLMEIQQIAINKSNRCKYPLNEGYNMTDGGDGGNGYKHTKVTLKKLQILSSNRKHTEETKKKISEANKNHPISEKQRLVASLTHKGKKLSEKHKRILSIRMSGRIISQEQKLLMSKHAATARAVAQYTLENNLLKIYKQIQYAANETGIGRSNISSVCQGRTKTAGGFKWKYVK